MAGVLAYFLVLQGLFGAYAQAAMAASGTGASVICSSVGTSDRDADAPLKDLAHDCCSTACQAACAIGPAMAPNDLGAAFDLNGCAHAWRPAPAVRAPPFHPGLEKEARGPPSLSI